MIERTKQLVEDRYCIANGFKHDAKVIVEVVVVVLMRVTTAEIHQVSGS